ncbi:MAG: hypothetical protein AAF990_04285 [Bacteroidota bacterium]
MEPYEKQLKETIDRYRSLALCKVHFHKLEGRLKESYTRKEQLGQLLEKEYKNIEKLQKLSLRSLFYRFLKDKDAQLEIERQEYLQAALQYKECVAAIESMEFERTVLLEKLEEEETLTKKLDDLLVQREAFLQRTHPEIRKELLSLAQDMDHKQGLKRELYEVLISGKRAEQTMTKVKRKLNEVMQWGEWVQEQHPYWLDSSAKKHPTIDEVQQLIYKLRQELELFQDELEDIFKFGNFPYASKYNGLQHFADIYIDNLLTDWVVHRKITDTLQVVHSQQSNLMRLLASLQNESKQCDRAMSYLDEKKRELLMNYIGHQ